VNGSHDVDDELRSLLCPNRNRGHCRRRLRRSPCVDQVSPAEQEHEPEKERAGEKPPARRGEGVQHVLHPAEEPVTRGWRECVETATGKM
jgi:hypothetical protein